MASGVYVIHFDTPLHHAQHYVGSSDNIERRLMEHAKGNGARLLQVLREKAIGWKVTLTIETDTPRELERQIKRQKNGRKMCPMCNGKGEA